MTTALPTPLPTRRDETWRYSDLKALQAAQSLPARLEPAGIRVAEGQTEQRVEHLAGAGRLVRNAAVTIEARGHLALVILQTADADAVVTASYEMKLAANARLDVFVLNLGSKLGRVELNIQLSGAGGQAHLAAVQLGTGQQTLELITRIDHVHPNAASQQIVRTVLSGQATGNYLGKIKVHKGAHGTDAKQSSKAIVLTRTATTNTKPELEIHADDVKCAHGATVGELDKAALFYLQSRGLALSQAKALLTAAFIADLVDGITDPAMQAQVTSLTETWLEEAGL